MVRRQKLGFIAIFFALFIFAGNYLVSAYRCSSWMMEVTVADGRAINLNERVELLRTMHPNFLAQFFYKNDLRKRISAGLDVEGANIIIWTLVTWQYATFDNSPCGIYLGHAPQDQMLLKELVDCYNRLSIASGGRPTWTYTERDDGELIISPQMVLQ